MSKLLDILLQRNDAAVAWGFRVCGGRDHSSQPIISHVTPSTLASQYLNVGDTLLEIEKLEANSLCQSEINGLIDNNGPCLQLLVEKRPAVKTVCVIPNGIRKSLTPETKNHLYETSTEQECIKEDNGVTHSTKIWLKERNRNVALGQYDLEVNFQRTKYRQNQDEGGGSLRPKESEKDKNRERMKVMSENFDKVFRRKIGEWLEENMLDDKMINRKQQSNVPSAGNGAVGGQPPPPPPPTLPGVIGGRRLKTELPERCLEPPAAIQNAMLTKDKKPFTYTPGGIDLSEIRSPRMARRINRNAQADEMPGIPAPTTNHHVPVENHGNTNYSAMQSQLPSQVLPPIGTAPPPPPPPPPPTAPATAPVTAYQPAASAPAPKPVAGKPALPFDPNELLARVNKSPAYEPSNNQIEPPRNFRPQPVEEKPNFLTQQRPKSGDIGQIYTPPQTEPAHLYTAPVSSKAQNEPRPTYVVNHPPRPQVSTASSSSPNVQEKTTPPSTPFGNKIHHNFTPASPPVSAHPEPKSQLPWVNVQRTPQPSVPWASREPESPKAGSTRIIPIQIEGRESPKPSSPSAQTFSTPPPFMQSSQTKQQQYVAQQPQQIRQQFPPTQNQQVRQQQASNTRVIPIQIEGGAQQPKSPVGGLPQNRFSPMTPQSPAPYSPSLEKDQKPQWASVQPKPFKKEPERLSQQQQQQQPQPEYGTYNTAGVPLSQLRKMQLSEDDRALMDKFKTQVELHGNDILNDENTNPRYKGGYIPSRVFKMLDESVDDETYLHRESDPRYRGAVIPSRAFRILQSMTDTAGEMHQQVPRSPPLTTVYGRSHGGAEYQQEPPQGPYVPPSEQQVQEPRKYTGGSIPSRSFRMLQAMTGQEVSASNSSGPSSGRETPVSGINPWYTSPSPSPIPDPYWPCYYPPDPYLLYNYISDLNAAYGFPPPPPPSPFRYPTSPLSPFHFYHMHPNCPNDNDEQGYSSTDELAQYYANYRRNFGYSPYQSNPDRSHPPTPVPFRVPRVCVTPVKRRDLLPKREKVPTGVIRDSKSKERFEREDEENSLEEGVDDEDEVETETEVDCEEEKHSRGPPKKPNSLLSLKSVSNMSLYTAQTFSSSSGAGEVEVEQEEGVGEEEEEDDEVSTSESFDETEPQELISHQLSVIFEESEHSEIDSIRLQSCENEITASESCSTLGNEEDDDHDLDEEDFSEVESSVTVRLPLRVTLTRLDNDEAITTVVVGNSVIERDGYSSMSLSTESNYPEEKTVDSESGDISVTFTLPSRSNSIASTDGTFPDYRKTCSNRKDLDDEDDQKEITGNSEVETEVTIHLSRSNLIKTEVEPPSKSAEKCESPQTEDESTSTSVQSGQTILNHKEDTDNENEEDGKKGEEEEKDEEKGRNNEEEEKTDEEKATNQQNEDGSETKDCNGAEGEVVQIKSYRDSMGRLEELISSMLESTRESMIKSLEYLQVNELKKKDSQEESEEDDSGVTSDMSLKQINSETDGDTESDYSELCKMTQFQRASTHSRLYKLLQEECEKSKDEEDKEDEDTEKNGKREKEPEDMLTFRKQRLTLPLNHISHGEADSLSSNSDNVSPSSPIVSDRLVKELIHSLLNRKSGKKFRKLPLSKLHMAAQKILQEELDTWDTSPQSGDDGLVASPTGRRGSHSTCTAESTDGSDQRYGDNYADYRRYYDTWNDRNLDQEDYEVIPSRTFRMLRQRTVSPMPADGLRVRCPRVASEKALNEAGSGRATPVVAAWEPEPGAESLCFARKREIVSKVLEKSLKS